MKSSDSDPNLAWDRVRQIKRGMGDLPRWFARGRRELDGTRSGGGGSGRREHAGVQACGCAGAGTMRKWAHGACARHRQACVGVVWPGAVLWQAHRGELRRGSTGGGVPAPGMAYVPRHLAQKVKGVAGLLTEARVRAVRSCRGVGDEVLRRRTGGARGGGAAGRAPAPGTRDRVRTGAVRVVQGSNRTKVHWRRVIVRAARLTGDGFGSKSGRCTG